MLKFLTEFVYRLGILFSQTCHFILYFICKLVPHQIISIIFQKIYKRTDINIIDKWAGGPDLKSQFAQKRPWDAVVHSKEVYSRALGYQMLGFGDAYVEGLWDVDDVEGMIYRASVNDLQNLFVNNPIVRFLDYFKFHLFNMQINGRSWHVGQQHYDLGNKFYEKMLDKNMNYTCAYFKNTEDLDQAQVDKMELIAQKLKLKPGMRVLDVGCGWGGLAKYLAEKHHVSVVGCTVSKEGGAYGQKLCEGLDVDIRVVDYRDIQNEKFDRIAVVGCVEHMGLKNYREFFEMAHKSLDDQGLLLIHTIGVHHSTMTGVDAWIDKHIFPHGYLPRPAHLIGAMDGLFILEDWHNFGHHYHLTLMHWLRNFEKNWPAMKNNFKEPEKFYRMWSYYLQFCSGLFRSRRTQLWQIVMSKGGVIGGYDSVR